MAVRRTRFPIWEATVAVCYFVVLLFELKVVFPIERILLPNFPGIISIVFFPHAVRVLSTVIFGPRVFFVLFPTILLSGYFLFGSYMGDKNWLLFIDAASGASCAPLAYLAVKWANRKNPDFRLDLQNWRMVLTIGVVASILNSLMRAILLGNYNTVTDIVQAVSKVFVGDMFGLMIGLVILVFAFRLVRRRRI